MVELVYEADYIENLLGRENLLGHENLAENSIQKQFIKFRNALLFLQKLDDSDNELIPRGLCNEIIRVILLPSQLNVSCSLLMYWTCMNGYFF